METSKPFAFNVFALWLKRRHYPWNCNRKQAWQDFVKEACEKGCKNVFQWTDENSLRKLLGLPYVDDDGWLVDGPFRTKEFKLN